MTKSDEEVLADFKEVINMTADELEAFLKTEESQGSTGAGWQKGDGSGESVGHESGRKIVEMLKKNPSKVSYDSRGRRDASFNGARPTEKEADF